MKLPNTQRKRDETSKHTTEERRNFQTDDGREAKLTRQELSLLRTEPQIRMHEQFDFIEVITRTSRGGTGSLLQIAKDAL